MHPINLPYALSNSKVQFQRTGHAEFFAGAGDADWRVTPPSLAVTQNTRGWLGIVVGARSQRVIRRFHENVEPTMLRQWFVLATPTSCLLWQGISRC